jgi:hypothetical protein
MDWKKFKASSADVHFHMQRFASVGVAIFAGVIALDMVFRMMDEYDDPNEPSKLALKALACLAIGFIAAIIHWQMMKKRFPDYPNHKRD